MSKVFLWVALVAALSSAGCSNSGDETPLSSKEQSLLGSWRLELANVAAEEFEFTYAFRRNGSFSNKIGGAFLQRIEELNEIDGIDIDTSNLDAIDGGFVEFNGTWSADGDSLDLSFETLQIEVFGTVPIVGRLAVPVHQESLTGSGENQIFYSCRFASEQLLLNGESLTLGIGLNETAQAVDLEPLAVETLGLVSGFVLDQISARDEDEFAMIRVE